MRNNTSTKVLLLGGISEAKKLAQQLHKNGISLVYSIQGSVRGFNADYEVASGGFSQYCDDESSRNSSVSGLSVFLEKNNITLIADVTHPYADTISVNAQESAKHTKTPYLQYTRPPWSLEKLSSSPWSLQVQELTSYEEILAETHIFKRLFWAIGYNSLATIEDHHPPHQQWIFRAAKKPAIECQEKPEQGVAHLDFIQQIGPFTVKDETELFQQKQIDALICKNSGGKFNEAKLKAASALDIPVFLLKRPNKIAANHQYSSIETLFNAIIARI
ncbi:MAG: precorrin-6A/cobalt-precorrin-6A reductase [Pseudomonadales bacterium]|nr:precorrin-6A/cobalt-precorrin-6A reductase [Pseudomonadales bacterium]